MVNFNIKNDDTLKYIIYPTNLKIKYLFIYLFIITIREKYWQEEKKIVDFQQGIRQFN
jgi:hypothetical protein